MKPKYIQNTSSENDVNVWLAKVSKGRCVH